MICERTTRKKRKAHKDEIRGEERKEKLIKTKLEEKKETLAAKTSRIKIEMFRNSF
jgi:hypothetical protein